MNFGELKTHVRAVTHRTDLTDDLFDQWNSEARNQIQNDLKDNVLISVTNVTPVTNPFFVALGNLEVMEVSYQSNGATIQLRNVSRDEYLLFNGTDGQPAVYSQEGEQIRVAPFVDGTEYFCTYRESLDRFTSDTDSTQLSAQRSQVYVYIFLQKAYEFLRDFVAADRYKALYDEQIVLINEREMYIDAGASGQMSGASFYQSRQGEH